MSKSTKKLISQRWDESFSEKMKKIASKLNITTTDLTIESLEFIAKLVESNPKQMKDTQNRKEFFQKLLEVDFTLSDNKLSRNFNKSSKKSRKEHAGYIIDNLANYLRENEDQYFSSTQLSEILSIPQPTVRTYIRNLAANDIKFKIVSGRPNFIAYSSKE